MAGPRASAVRARSFGSGHAPACGTASGFASGFATGAGRDPLSDPLGAQVRLDTDRRRRLRGRASRTGAPTWFPCNDYPTDKATYDFRVTVPRGTTAVANGTLEGRIEHRHWTTFVWSETLADGDLPRHGHHRQVPGDAVGRRRDPVVRGRGSRQAPARAAGAVEDPRHPPPCSATAFGAYPFEADRSDRRPHVLGGLRAGDPDQAPLPSGPGHRDPRPRAGASVVRRRRDAEALAPRSG